MFPIRSHHWRIFPLALLLIISTGTCHAWTINLPGGGRVAFDDGVLRIGQPSASNSLLIIPPADTFISEAIVQRIAIQSAGAEKGYGAFCVLEGIPQDTFLGFYPTTSKIFRDLEQPLEQPIVDNGGEYLLSIDGGVTFLDGYERAQDRTVFSPAHLNHADSNSVGCNCVRLSSSEQPSLVAFFTARDIAVGEELCFDYGSNYWRGREDEKV
ncbi:expressed unknown protein [Seminavis robusta]|uniref:SET domain-containing protein n=1 Tax=Seminavis robusta TaxID=568900 RepID=A0A9N8EYB9_9STRA|nr:expressed unknown protein [Seminavis robusta]|eukprot:Sro2464_g328470.1 n/a (212) ;mRNA; f:2085-2720